MTARERRFRRALWAAVWTSLFAGVAAQAVVPLPGRTMNAIAGVNRVSGRTKALQLELKMRVGNEPPIATGEMISHPSGLARMEIRGFDGRLDRYLLTGDELSATTNGRRLLRPRPLLQPYFLLQPDSESTLRTALETFGVRTRAIGFAPCSEGDCLVIGDPRLAAPLPLDRPDPDAAAFDDLGLETNSGESRLRSLRAEYDDEDEPIEGPLPRFWVDTEDLQAKRIDRADGVVVIFGPVARFDRIQVPAWFEIHDPQEAFPMRFEVERAVHVNAPPKAFDRDWLIPETPAQAGNPG